MVKEMDKEHINMKMVTGLLDNGKMISNFLVIIDLLMEINFKENLKIINLILES